MFCAVDLLVYLSRLQTLYSTAFVTHALGSFLNVCRNPPPPPIPAPFGFPCVLWRLGAGRREVVPEIARADGECGRSTCCHEDCAQSYGSGAFNLECGGTAAIGTVIGRGFERGGSGGGGSCCRAGTEQHPIVIYNHDEGVCGWCCF